MKKLIGAAAVAVTLSLSTIASTWGCYIGTIPCKVTINGTVYTYTCCWSQYCSYVENPTGGCTPVLVGCC